MAAVKAAAVLAAFLLLAGSCRAQTLAESIQAAREPGTPAAPVAVSTDVAAAPETAESAAAPDDTVAAGAPLETKTVTPTVLGSNIVPNNVYEAPVAKYLSSTNASTFSITWLAIEAANLAESLNDVDLAVTIFAPTNAAWERRLPSITGPNDIAPHDLFSVGKSDALRGIMQYHILSTVLPSARAIKGALSTSSNLCSNAKDLKATQADGSILLESAGGTQAYILDLGVKLGNPATKRYSTIYPIDDLLLPDVVTVPLNVALQAYNTRVQGLVEAVRGDAAAINSLDQSAATTPAEPLAPAAAGPEPDAFDSPISAGRKLF